MQFSRKIAPFLGLAALGLMATAPALAQSVITLNSSANYNNTGGDGNGYDANTAGDTYTVASPATFDGNFYKGLFVGNSTVTVNGGEFNSNGTGLGAFGSTVTVNGGSFNNNTNNGLLTGNGSTITITGGAFDNNNIGLIAANGSTVTVNGGAFDNNNYGLYAVNGSNVTVNGGDFSGNNGADLFADSGSAITLYGSFVGGTRTLAITSNGVSDNFTGTLENNTKSQQFSYLNFGVINLVNGPAPVPEPSSVASFAIGGLGLMGLGLKARKRRVAIRPASQSWPSLSQRGEFRLQDCVGGGEPASLLRQAQQIRRRCQRALALAFQDQPCRASVHDAQRMGGAAPVPIIQHGGKSLL